MLTNKLREAKGKVSVFNRATKAVLHKPIGKFARYAQRCRNADRVEVDAEVIFNGEIFEFAEKVLELVGNANKDWIKSRIIP